MAIFNMVGGGWGWGWVIVPSYLCFTANTAQSTIQLTKIWSPTTVTLEKSTDWTTWTTYTIWDTITLTNIWDKVYFRNTSETDTGFSTWYSNYYKFVMTGSISGSWDVNYLLNKYLATRLPNYCYLRLFQWCSSLTTAPSLFATKVWEETCSSMFSWCSNLTTAPSLFATKLGTNCYNGMFRWCSSLTTAPDLPATILAGFCYIDMFNWCSNLVKAPNLPAKSLTDYCYWYMFSWCVKLTTLPKFSVTTFSQNCCNWMFNWCSKIKLSTTQTWEYQTAYRIPISWTGTSGYNSLKDMFKNTGWTFTWTPSINTTYYTSNEVI